MGSVLGTSTGTPNTLDGPSSGSTLTLTHLVLLSMYYVQLIAAVILFHGVLLLIVDGMLVAAGLSRR